MRRFLGSLRTFLMRAEPIGGRVATIAFAAGMVGYGLTVLALAPQIASALPGRTWIEPATAGMAVDLGYVMLTLANLPMAVMYAAVAIVSLRAKAFPVWLGWSPPWPPPAPRLWCSRWSTRPGRSRRWAGSVDAIRDFDLGMITLTTPSARLDGQPR